MIMYSLSLQIENIVHSRQNEVSFNTSWLENLYEEIILETQGNVHVIMYINIMFKRSINYMYMYSVNSVGDHVTPLVSNSGRILLTSSRIYFQPSNNVEAISQYVDTGSCYHLYITGPVVKLELLSLTHKMKCWYMLR